MKKVTYDRFTKYIFGIIARTDGIFARFQQRTFVFGAKTVRGKNCGSKPVPDCADDSADCAGLHGADDEHEPGTNDYNLCDGTACGFGLDDRKDT